MKPGCCVTAAGQDEGVEWIEPGIELVDFALQPVDLAFGHAKRLVIGWRIAFRHAKIRAQIEQVVLDPGQWRVERVAAAQRGAGEAKGGIGLVNIPVGVDPGIVFDCLRHVAKPGFPGIAGARVDFRETNHGASLSVRTARLKGRGIC